MPDDIDTALAEIDDRIAAVNAQIAEAYPDDEMMMATLAAQGVEDESDTETEDDVEDETGDDPVKERQWDDVETADDPVKARQSDGSENTMPRHEDLPNDLRRELTEDDWLEVLESVAGGRADGERVERRTPLVEDAKQRAEAGEHTELSHTGGATRTDPIVSPLVVDALALSSAAAAASPPPIDAETARRAAERLAKILDGRPGFVLAAGNAAAARVINRAKDATIEYVAMVKAGREAMEPVSAGFVERQRQAIAAGVDRHLVASFGLEEPGTPMRRDVERRLIESVLGPGKAA